MKNIINFLLLILLFIFPINCFAQKTLCSAKITTEYNIGISSAVYVSVNISAKNTLSESVDGVMWQMFSKSGKLLFNETWVGINQKTNFVINPKLIGINPIAPGETTPLGPIALFNHVEFLIRDKKGSDGNEMKNMFEKRLSEAKEKYTDVSCRIIGFVKKMKF